MSSGICNSCGHSCHCVGKEGSKFERAEERDEISGDLVCLDHDMEDGQVCGCTDCTCDG